MSSSETSEPNRPQDRDALMSNLAKGKPALTWLSQISADALAVLNPEIVASIQQAFESTIQTPEAPPAPSQPPPGTMKSLASSAAGHVFSSEELFAIKKLIDSQATMAAPTHYIQPKMVFGTKEMTTEQESKLASLRRDTKCQASLENTLSWVNDKIEEFPEVSESAFIRHLHSVLPLHTLRNLELLRIQHSNLGQIFLYLQLHHGNLKSPSQLYTELNRLTESVGEDDPLRTMEQVSQLLLQVSDGSEECSKSALRESLKYLKNVLSDESYLMIVQRLGRGSFSDLLSLCKGEFSEILLSRYRKLRAERHKVRSIEVQPDREIITVGAGYQNYPGHQNPPQPEKEKYDLCEMLRQISGQPLICYNCRKEGHYSRQCPLPITPRSNNPTGQKSNKSYSRPPFPNSSQPSRAPYHTLSCFIHENSSHSNGECHIQQNKGCDAHQGHHALAACRKMTYPKQKTRNPNPNPNPNPTTQQYSQSPPSQPPWTNQNPTWNAPNPQSQPQQPPWNQQSQNPNQWRPQPVPLLPTHPQPNVAQPMGNALVRLPANIPNYSQQPNQPVRQLTHQGAGQNFAHPPQQPPEGFQADLYKLLSHWGMSPN